MGTHPIFESDFDCLTDMIPGPKIIGPRCSGFCMLVSAWGIVMFILLGIFFHIKSPALRDDISPASDSQKDVYDAYDNSAYYVATLLFSMWQVGVNRRSVKSFENQAFDS